MKCIIAGSRHLNRREATVAIKNAVIASGWSGDITEIVHGGCYGVDLAAGDLCKDFYPIMVFPADWTLGKSAGPIRNRKMAEYADRLIAIPRKGEENRGTNNMIETMRSLGKPVFVWEYPAQEPAVYDGKTLVWARGFRCGCGASCLTRIWTQGPESLYRCTGCREEYIGDRS